MCVCVRVFEKIMFASSVVLPYRCVDKAQCVMQPLVGRHCGFLLWAGQFDRKSKSRINVTSSLMDALFSPVLLLLFFPAVDKRLHLWLIKHVSWPCASPCTCVCMTVCMKICVRVFICVCVHGCTTVHWCLCVFCIFTCISPFCFLSCFDLPLVSPIGSLLVYRRAIDSAKGYKLRFKRYVTQPIEFYI